MLIELEPTARAILRPLFEGLPGVHGCLDAVLDGGMGTAHIDDARRPTAAFVRLEDFCLVAGDATLAVAEEAIRSLRRPATVIPSDASWERLLRRLFGDGLRTRTRVQFRPGRWDEAHLRGFIGALPGGFTLKRITAADAARFEALAGTLVSNFGSPEEFAARGVGFGIEHEGRFVSGCSSFALSPHSLEFEIQTHPEFRRRGLACATAARMIEHCLVHQLEPCWDAHNDMSAALAEKLGFVDPAPYNAYELPS
jgi:GNAT superfamily N-acetyltransferase